MSENSEFKTSRRAELQKQINDLRQTLKEEGYVLWVTFGDEYGGMQGGELILSDQLQVR